MTNTKLDELDLANSYPINLGSTLDLFGRRTREILKGKGYWNQVLQIWRIERRRTAIWQAVADLPAFRRQRTSPRVCTWAQRIRLK